MKNFIKKLTSRKFLTCMAGFIFGVCLAFGLNEGTINIIAGAIASVSSAVVYIYTEGKLDAEAMKKVKDAVEQTGDAIDAIKDITE